MKVFKYTSVEILSIDVTVFAVCLTLLCFLDLFSFTLFSLLICFVSFLFKK